MNSKLFLAIFWTICVILSVVLAICFVIDGMIVFGIAEIIIAFLNSIDAYIFWERWRKEWEESNK